MTTNENNRINNLFIKLEFAEKAANHYNQRCQTADENADSYNRVFEEALQQITIIQKQLVRALLKANAIDELLCHVSFGTLPKYSIHCALGKRPQ
jgi:uncharacterized protein YpiB (UPF0302 family)